MAKAENIRSMTAYGSGTAESASVSLEVEIRGVNSRFFDAVFKLPRVYYSFESDLRQIVSAEVKRGRVDFQVMRVVKKGATSAVRFNQEIFESYRAVYEKIAKKSDIFDKEIEKDILLSLLSRHEILGTGEEESLIEGEKELLVEASRQALKGFIEMSLVEGRALHDDVLNRIEAISKTRKDVAKLSNGNSKKLQERLMARIEKLSPEVQLDPDRLAQEVAHISDKVDVTEELVRLESHISQFRDTLNKPSSGRKLDFILQEFGRELNTIGSKVQDAPIQALIVDAKAEMEKIKEQIQNLE